MPKPSISSSKQFIWAWGELIRVLWVVSVSLLAGHLHFHVNARLCAVVLTSPHKQFLCCCCQLCCRRVCHQASCPFLPSPLHPPWLSPCPLWPVLSCVTLTCQKELSVTIFSLRCTVHGASPCHERGEQGRG